MFLYGAEVEKKNLSSLSRFTLTIVRLLRSDSLPQKSRYFGVILKNQKQESTHEIEHTDSSQSVTTGKQIVQLQCDTFIQPISQFKLASDTDVPVVLSLNHIQAIWIRPRVTHLDTILVKNTWGSFFLSQSCDPNWPLPNSRTRLHIPVEADEVL